MCVQLMTPVPRGYGVVLGVVSAQTPKNLLTQASEELCLQDNLLSVEKPEA
jgi:hypothetical protein